WGRLGSGGLVGTRAAGTAVAVQDSQGGAGHLSRPRGLLGPCAATSGMHGPEGGGAQQCAPPTRPDGPPHRSQRALLTHWAPALGTNVEAFIRVGVQDAGG